MISSNKLNIEYPFLIASIPFMTLLCWSKCDRFAWECFTLSKHQVLLVEKNVGCIHFLETKKNKFLYCLNFGNCSVWSDARSWSYYWEAWLSHKTSKIIRKIRQIMDFWCWFHWNFFNRKASTHCHSWYCGSRKNK